MGGLKGLLAGSIVLVTVCQAWSADEPPPAHFAWGALEMRPAAHFSTAYDSNIFKINPRTELAGQETGDIYVTVNPRLAFRLPTDRGALSAGYGWQGVKYLQAFADAPTPLWDAYDTHTFFAEGKVAIGEGGTLGLRNETQRKNLFMTAIDIAALSPASRDELRPIGMWQNELKPVAGYRLGGDGRLEFESSYMLRTDRFAAAGYRYLDKDLHAPLAKVSYRYFPQTAVFVQGEGYVVRYVRPGAGLLDKTKADGWKAFTGVQGAITPRLTLTLAAGWGRLVYGGYTRTPAFARENADTWLAKGELTQRFSERMRLTLGGGRDVADSFSTNFFRAHRANAELWRSLTPSWAVVAEGNYYRNQYSRPDPRFDQGFLAGGKLEWKPLTLPWLTLDGGYHREERSSSVAFYRFQSNQIFGDVSAEF